VSGQIPGYPVDIALCIDATGSMTPIIDQVKRRATDFHGDLTNEMAAKGKPIDRLRLRVVVFRDVYVDGQEALNASDFFDLPEDAERFSRYVGGIQAKGGGDEPESGLEALATAMHSPWATSGTRRRQVIVVWTDASAHQISEGTHTLPAGTPGLPATFDELTDLWSDPDGPMEPHAQRLILYAPDVAPWSVISSHWPNVIHHPSAAGSGLRDVDYRTILDVIAQSV
jgi:hypothetical protein